VVAAETDEPRVLTRTWAAGAVLALLVLTLTAGIVARARSHRADPVEGSATASWGPKTVALEEIPERAHFRPVMPRALPGGLRLGGAQMVWVREDEFDARLRPRQAIRFVYQGRSRDREMSITEVEHITSVEPRDNVWQVLSQGYFEPDHSMQSLLSVGKASGIDFIIVSDGVSQQDLEKVKDSLAPMEVGNRGSKVESRQ
jgi:hypothetical protein